MGLPIAVDFHGTLTSGEGEYYWNDPLDEYPNDDMVELIRGLYHRNHIIIVYTAASEQYRPEIEYYLRKWEVPYHALRCNKLSPALFIDNSALHHERALELGVNGIENWVYGD